MADSTHISPDRPDPPADSPPPSASSRGSLPLSEQQTVISKSPQLQAKPARPTELARSLEGEQLGHYRLEEFVGGGGMGAVFRGVDLELGRTVAVKVVPCDETDEETLRRFKTEAKSAARLDHGRIARVFNVGTDKGWHYIVFEFIEGVNIRDLVHHKGPLSLEEAWHYTRQVAEALEHAWQREVVHRDIKPSNVLVMQDGTVKVVDMGLARLHHVESSSDDATASGVTLGTFDYISPEQARDPREADVRSDLYSLGCTTFYMLAGQPPFPEGTVLQKLLRHSSEEPPAVADYRPDLPESICHVVARLLAKQPADRYATPTELIEALDMVARTEGILALPPARSLPEGPTRSPLRYLAWLIPVAALLLIGAALEWPAGAELAPAPVSNLLPQVASSDEAASGGAAEPPAAGGAAPSDPLADDGSAEEAESAPTEPEPPEDDSNVVGIGPRLSQQAAVGARAASAGPPAADVQLNATVAPLDPTRIAVVPAGETAPSNVTVAETLSDALQMADRMAELETIELHFSRSVPLPALRIARRQSLTIRAAEGHRPELRFQPQAADLPPKRRMISIAGGQLKMEGLDLRLELPDSTPYEGWSLFHLDRRTRLDLSRCTMTIRNRLTNGDELHHNVAFLELEADTSTDMNRPDEAAVGSRDRTTIALNSCVARGQATMLRCETGSEFTLKWSDGFFASSHRLLEAGGVMSADNGMRMRIALERVTAYVEQGLCLVSPSSTEPHLIDLMIDLTSCVVACGEGAPLIEHLNVESRESVEGTQLFGIDNLIDERHLLWRVMALQGPSGPVQLGATELGLIGAPSWSSPIADQLPAHEMAPADFQLDHQLDGEPPGGDPLTLPQPR